LLNPNSPETLRLKHFDSNDHECLGGVALTSNCRNRGFLSVVTRFDVPMFTNGDGDRRRAKQGETPSELNADGVVT